MRKNSIRLLVWSLTLALTASLAGGAITGVVIDRDGKPVEGATVTAFAPEPRQARLERMLSGRADAEPLASVKTDSRGKFELDTKGAYSQIRIEAPAFVPAFEMIADGPLGAIALDRGKTANIVIVGGGKPVEGALVAFGSTAVRSDAEGRVSIPYTGTMLPAIEIFHADFATQQLAPRHPPRSITLEAGVTVAGRIVDAAGKPVPDARIEIDGYPLGTSDEEGAFAIARAPEGWKEIIATQGDRLAAASRRGNGPYELKLARGAMISGTVTGPGSTPLPGAVVHLRPHASRTFRFSSTREASEGAVADAKGNFMIGPVAPGSYDIWTSRAEYGFAPVAVDLRSGERVARAIAGERLGTIQGTVLDDNERPVAAAEVSAAPERRTMVAMMQRGAPSGPDGAFVLRGVQTGQILSVTASRPGYPRSEPEAVELRAGDRKSGVILTIPRGILISGVVTDEDGVAIANARVLANESRGDVPGEFVIRRLAGGVREEEGVTTGVKGDFALRANRGRYDLAVSAEGYAPGLVRGIEVAPDLQPINVTLKEGVEVSGRVVRADGSGVPDAMVNVFGEGVGASRATTAPDGSFALSDLPRGTLNLMVMKPDEYIRESKIVEAPSQNVLIELAPSGGLRGRVVEEGTKRPVSDFRAGPSGERRGPGLVMMGPTSLRSFRSDDGTFELTNLPVGSIELIVEAPGFVPAKVPVEIEEGKVLESVEVVLDPGTRISGRVSGPDGSPLSGVSVGVRSADAVRMGNLPRGMFGGAVTTDANGEFTLEGVAEGKQSMVAEREGYLADTKSVEVEGREMRVDFRLGRGTDVTGTVVTDAGLPVSQARVSARTSAAGGEFESARTDANGHFRLTGLAPGRYTFYASHDQYVSGETKDVDIATSGPVRITLTSGGTISGRVSGLRDGEMTSTTVRASAGTSSATSTVGPDGSFRITGAPTGTVRVHAQVFSMQNRRTSTPRTVEVAPGTETHVDLDMSSGHSITGRVTRDGRPVEGGSINFSPRDPRVATNGGGRTDGSGRYEISGLEEGAYDVRVFDSVGTFMTEYSVSGPAAFDIDIVGTSVRGTVVDASTNEPIDGATVVAQQPPGSSVRVVASPVRTDSRGSFLLGSMSPGTYSVRASKDGFGQHVEQLVVGESSEVILELRLQRADGVGLKIVDARDGRRLGGYASVADAMGRVAWEGRVQTAGDEFTNLPLAAGRYRVLVNASGYAARTVDLQAPAPGFTVTLSPGGTVRIEAVFQDRTLARLLDGNGQPWRRYSMQAPPEFVLDGTGITLQNVAPGSYTLEILDGAGTVADRESFTVLEGQTVVVRP